MGPQNISAPSRCSLHSRSLYVCLLLVSNINWDYQRPVGTVVDSQRTSKLLNSLSYTIFDFQNYCLQRLQHVVCVVLIIYKRIEHHSFICLCNINDPFCFICNSHGVIVVESDYWNLIFYCNSFKIIYRWTFPTLSAKGQHIVLLKLLILKYILHNFYCCLQWCLWRLSCGGRRKVGEIPKLFYMIFVRKSIETISKSFRIKIVKIRKF